MPKSKKRKQSWQSQGGMPGHLRQARAKLDQKIEAESGAPKVSPNATPAPHMPPLIQHQPSPNVLQRRPGRTAAALLIPTALLGGGAYAYHRNRQRQRRQNVGKSEGVWTSYGYLDSGLMDAFDFDVHSRVMR